mmetsp:Transcript_7451/g.17081  ORF Transcript_7451/g.17081 Transcript_7451/m.17081 type:complete len:98 (-) Transcript_7451:267-560(-)
MLDQESLCTPENSKLSTLNIQLQEPNLGHVRLTAVVGKCRRPDLNVSPPEMINCEIAAVVEATEPRTIFKNKKIFHGYLFPQCKLIKFQIILTRESG